MEWVERLNTALNYLEEKLTDDIDYDELAKSHAVLLFTLGVCFHT